MKYYFEYYKKLLYSVIVNIIQKQLFIVTSYFITSIESR